MKPSSVPIACAAELLAFRAPRGHDRVAVVNVRVGRSLGMSIHPGRHGNEGLEVGRRFPDQIAAFFELKRASIRDAVR
jgi:hypothetical protein